MGAALALQRIQRERGLQIIVKNKAEVGTLGTFLLLPGCLRKSCKGGCVGWRALRRLRNLASPRHIILAAL
jgi:hypothetical protein